MKASVGTDVSTSVLQVYYEGTSFEGCPLFLFREQEV